MESHRALAPLWISVLPSSKTSKGVKDSNATTVRGLDTSLASVLNRVAHVEGNPSKPGLYSPNLTTNASMPFAVCPSPK